MTTQDDVSATKLFQTFRTRVLDEAPGEDATALTKTLCRDAGVMREFDSAEPKSVAGSYFRALEGADTTTVLPLTLLLFLLDDLDGRRRDRALIAIESYLVRRMLMGHTTKRYNQFFVDLLPAVAAQPDTADDAILAGLSSSSAVTAVWPSDDELRAHLLSHPLYGWIARSRIEYVLWEVELMLRDSSKTEDIVAKPKKLSIEHVLPQQWERTWPLEAPTDENMAHRTGLVNVLGNLTLVTGELNSSMSNSTWATKRQRLEKSILLLNSDVKAVPAWGETAIQERGNSLAEMILRRWPGPGAMVPGFDPANLKTAIVEVGAELTDMTDAEITTVVIGASPLLTQLLRYLAANPGDRKQFIDIELALGWSRGRLASVLGGYAGFANSRVDGKRPFALGRDEEGWNWMWMDQPNATVVSGKLDDGI